MHSTEVCKWQNLIAIFHNGISNDSKLYRVLPSMAQSHEPFYYNIRVSRKSDLVIFLPSVHFKKMADYKLLNYKLLLTLFRHNLENSHRHALDHTVIKTPAFCSIHSVIFPKITVGHYSSCNL